MMPFSIHMILIIKNKLQLTVSLTESKFTKLAAILQKKEALKLYF